MTYAAWNIDIIDNAFQETPEVGNFPPLEGPNRLNFELAAQHLESARRLGLAILREEQRHGRRYVGRGEEADYGEGDVWKEEGRMEYCEQWLQRARLENMFLMRADP